MRKKNIMTVAVMLILTTIMIYCCNYYLGIPLMLATLVTCIKGIASCLRNILDIITE